MALKVAQSELSLLILMLLLSIIVFYSALSFKGQEYSASYAYLQQSGCSLSLHYNITGVMHVRLWKDTSSVHVLVLQKNVSGAGMLQTNFTNFTGRVVYELYRGKILEGSEAHPYTLFKEVECA